MTTPAPPTLLAIAADCRRIIEAAEADGLTIGDGDVVDLIADNTPHALQTIREALVVAGYAPRFPRATHPRSQHGAA